MSNDDDVIELTDDGVFVIPSPTSKSPAINKDCESDYPTNIPGHYEHSHSLSDIAEGNYKIWQDSASIYVAINVPEVEGAAHSLEWKDKTLRLRTTNESDISIDLKDISVDITTQDISKAKAHRHGTFLVVVMPYKK